MILAPHCLQLLENLEFIEIVICDQSFFYFISISYDLNLKIHVNLYLCGKFEFREDSVGNVL